MSHTNDGVRQESTTGGEFVIVHDYPSLGGESMKASEYFKQLVLSAGFEPGFTPKSDPDLERRILALLEATEELIFLSPINLKRVKGKIVHAPATFEQYEFNKAGVKRILRAALALKEGAK